MLECTSMSFLPEEWRAKRRQAGRPGQATGTHGRDSPLDRAMMAKNIFTRGCNHEQDEREQRHRSNPLAGRENRRPVD